MLCAGYTKVWDLSAGELVRLDGARGTTLRVTRGRLWVTLENDTRDIVLAAGDSYTCATKADATLWCWGWGYNGETAHGEGWYPLPIELAP